MSSKKSKEATHQEDIARQRESAQTTLNSLLAQLAPGSEEYTRLSTEGGRYVQDVSGPADEEGLIRQLGQELIQAQQARIASGGAATPLEARTNLSFQGLRDKAAFTPEEQAVLSSLRGTPMQGAENVTGQIFADLVGRAQTPDSFYESTLGPQLQLATDAVKARAASRGVLGSGLELENLGRAGVDLAIKEAAARQNFRQQQLGNFMSLFNAGQGLRNREIGLEDSLLNLQQGRESRLSDILNTNSFNRGSDFANLFQRQTGRAEDLADSAAASEASRNAAIGKTVGTGVGAAGGFFVGGPTGAMTGANLGSQLFGGDVSGQLAAQRTQATPSGAAPDLSALLRRTPGSGNLSPEDFATLLRGGGY